LLKVAVPNPLRLVILFTRTSDAILYQFFRYLGGWVSNDDDTRTTIASMLHYK